MFCSLCRTHMDSAYKYCPQCGSPLNSPTAPPIDPAAPTSKTVKKRRMPFWFKLASFLAVVALIAVTAGILFTESWVDVVDHQLMALRDQDIATAYTYTSQDFQSATSLDDFRRFIEAYPLFKENQSAHFQQRSIDRHIGTLQGLLTSQQHVDTPIEYKLIKEDNKWKILSMRLLKPDQVPHTEDHPPTEALIAATQGQLTCIQKQQLQEAYDDYSAREFKDASSYDTFVAFINKYPILMHYHTCSFHKPTIRNGIGSVAAIVQSNGTAAYVKYYLIEENRQWKIWSMRVLSSPAGYPHTLAAQLPEDAQECPAPPGMHFGKLSVGTLVGENGQIKHPGTVFYAPISDLYVDVCIKNGHKQGVVYLHLHHLESDVSIPAKAEIEENGDSLLMSVFSPPANGWSKGHYSLRAAFSSGVAQKIEFEIR